VFAVSQLAHEVGAMMSSCPGWLMMVGIIFRVSDGELVSLVVVVVLCLSAAFCALAIA
jgi:hypothetical protein